MFREKGMRDLGRKVSSWNFQSISAAVSEEVVGLGMSGGREKVKSGRKESQLQIDSPPCREPRMGAA